MKTLVNKLACPLPGRAKPLIQSKTARHDGFTLVELLVVLGVIAVLIVLQLPVWAAAGKSQSKIAVCASHVRQLALCCQIYANDNGGLLPVLNRGGYAPWDLPATVANALLKNGAQTNTFYCPGTAPRFTDAQNWAGPNPSGQTTGAYSTLWGFGVDASPSYHVIGYVFALSGSTLFTTNQNHTIQSEAIPNFPSTGTTTTYSAAQRVLVADATICQSTIPRLPGYLHPENNYVNIAGGFQWNGGMYPHLSPHLNGDVPAGGNLGFKDGHVAWRDFEFMTPRSNAAYTFWW